MDELMDEDDLDLDTNPNLEDEDTLMYHLVLPRELPQSTAPNLWLREYEMVERMSDLSREWREWLPNQTIQLLTTLKRFHKDRTPEDICKKIIELRPGDNFAIFVRSQHCALVINVPADETANNVQNVIVSAFPGCLESKEVYSHSSDIEFNYPERSVNVKFTHMLRSREFANQLCVLNEIPTLGDKRLDWVSKWLIALLMDETSTMTTEAEFPRITKKIRDEIWGNSVSYFRRSTFYMSLKAIVHHSLTLQLGAGAGKTLYKIFMLKFLAGTCDPYIGCTRFNIDLLSQMSAKLARRIEKLSNMMIADDDNLADLFNETINVAKDTIKRIHKKIDAQITTKLKIVEKHAKLPVLCGLDFEADICYKTRKLEERTKTRDQNATQAAENGFKPAIFITYERYIGTFNRSLPNPEVISTVPKSSIAERIFWIDFERLVLYRMKIGDNIPSFEHVRTWSIAYAQFTASKYNNNQLFISRMTLVRLKLIAMLDEQATKNFPLLKEHYSGIIPEIINDLLLPQSEDMKIAHEVEQYFRRRDDRAIDPSLIAEKGVTENSFSVKYAKDDLDMQQTLNEISLRDKLEIERKENEWKTGREKAATLLRDASAMTCDTGRNNSHSHKCRRCTLRAQANDVEIRQYEHLLPNDETLQLGIVFEIKIPEEIACLRDILYSFAEYSHGESKKLSIKSNWQDQISPYIIMSGSKCEYVQLGSTVKPTLETLKVFECSMSRIIVQNGSNCIFHAKHRAIPTLSTVRIKKMCTFDARNEFKELQWTLHGTNHNENSVLASQNRCSTDLKLSDYKNFGSLRADGYRCQLRKLYAMIETEALPFEKEDVLALVMQTLWECGVSGDVNYIRESHLDFHDAIFCNAMIDLLGKFVEQQRSNWMHPIKLLTVALIAVRAFEINETERVAIKIVKLLNRVRSIALDWILSIEKSIREMTNADERTERSLRLKLIYVTIIVNSQTLRRRRRRTENNDSDSNVIAIRIPPYVCNKVVAIGCLTFFIHPKHKHYQKVFPNSSESKTAVESWLRFSISLKNNVRMYTNNEERLSPNLRMFLRLIESIGVYLEPKVNDVCEQSCFDFICALIRIQWPSSERAVFTNVYFDQTQPHILVAKTTLNSNDQTVTIDIITGSFLVDGLPLSRLPNVVMHSDSYRWFFEDIVFEVQPDAQHNFSTVQKYNDCSYEFKMIDHKLIIIERQGNVVERELIDHIEFEDDFPYYLVQNYSHWWNKNDNCIEFRKRTFGKEHFSKVNTIDYRLNLVNYHLIQETSKRPMLAIKSESYKRIVQQLAGLEHPKYIHILYYAGTETQLPMAKVELLRMNLKFTLECLKKSRRHCDLISNEFDMRVVRDQTIGTLSGLKQGLLLESKNSDKQIILIPNGPIHVRNNDSFAHVSINMKEDSLRSPPFYQYEVDKYCRQLKSRDGSHASWFFLAYLHAVTSHVGIDTFTGMSGTERAIQILQLALAWSSSPYESEAYKILRDIALLTPLRVLKDDIQSVTWPKGIPMRSAQDCFNFITKTLLDDSQRLRSLHNKDSDKTTDNPNHKFELNTNVKLNVRDHRRCQQLNPNLNVSNTFLKHKVLKTSPAAQNQAQFSRETRIVSILYHQRKFMASVNPNLKELLMGRERTLNGMENSDRVKDLLNHSVPEDFRDLWISLYVAVIKQQLNRQQIAMILSFFAHRNRDSRDYKAILALQAVAANPISFQHIVPPATKLFKLFAKMFKANEVSNTLRKFYTQPAAYKSREWLESGEKSRHDLKLNSTIDHLTATIKVNWPCSSFSFAGRDQEFKFINYQGAEVAINEKLKTWHANFELSNFIKSVEARLATLVGSRNVSVPPCFASTIAPIKWRKFSIDFEAKMRNNSDSFREEVEKARNVWRNEDNTMIRSASEWLKYLNKTWNSHSTNHLSNAGLFPRIVPSVLLPKIMDANFDDDWKCLIGAYAIQITREQRENRIRGLPQSSAAAQKENENEPYVNWSPCEYPEWLLFEIEQNVTIRRIQIEIAKRMIDPPETNTKHSVMQLNMGEGKTAVIVPILAARLANGAQACQVIVLKPLFARNLKSLRQYLGGLLNRRVYTFPFRRDLPVESQAPNILGIYEECKREKGVILTLPERILSFELKILESISVQLKADLNRDFTTTNNLLDIFKWTNANVRTIMDESDAILDAKYQLIYTVGNQKQPDGNSLRWLVAQALLKRVPYHMNTLYEAYGKEKVEFGHNDNMSYRPDVFIPCRILDETMFEKLKDALIEDFFAGRIDIDFPGIDDAKKPALKCLLSEKAIKRATLKVIEDFSEEKQNIILILSGLLRFEVLKMALTKRWRVNYGVDVKGNRKMAIPFKAKDVAAELTEFGHPDVAVCLTQMSYYYSGLTDRQLYQVFDLLENSPDAVNIYEKWIEKIPHERVDVSIKSYKGVNLDDPDQRDRLLFPLFRFNMNVIDFWLSNVVYPHELKIFEKKLMCTAWDLCSDQLKHRVTGFSGTNDTQNTLPITIAQSDLPELNNTNEEMRQTLLDRRNRVYKNKNNITGKNILQELVRLEIPVLLDSGALMLELNNKEVAIEWLKLAPNCSAAVYFDENDTLQTIDHNGIVTEFDYSVYRDDLSNCVVYLDDVHTRGTDLKFPPDSMACVTLSGDITRDKLVQSCMRMRQLRTTQSILFWASNEADIRLRELSRQRDVTSEHVMQFIENNSRLFETSNMPHWTASALNYTRKIIGHKNFEKPLENPIDPSAVESIKLETLYNTCVHNDFIKLDVMYGEKEEVLLKKIARDKFTALAFDDDSDELEFVQKMQRLVHRKLVDRAPNVKRFTHAMDEEQEKELEQEIEEYQQIERPKQADAAKPRYDPRLEKLITDEPTGTTYDQLKADGVLLSIVTSLAGTQMAEFCENNKDAWADYLFVTRDFNMVIENQTQVSNDFLRPVCWVACVKNPDAKDILILLSTFECNHLMPAFRDSVNATLFMYQPRLSNLHSNLIREPELRVTKMLTVNNIAVEDEVQIGLYAGLMYFKDEEEQSAYCEFLGIIPRPWTREQMEAFHDGNIEENGYVPRKRNYPESISQSMSQCKFKSNPTDLAIKLIKARHQILPKDSHVASILNRGIKAITDDNMDVDY